MLKILELDLTDPICPVECDDPKQKTLPLYYPLCFDFGGGEAHYTLRSSNELTLFNTPAEDQNYEEYPFPEALPEQEVSLVEFTYEQFRALLMRRHGWGEISASDELLLKKYSVPPPIQIGGEISPIQGQITAECANKKCEWAGRMARVDVFAEIPSAPIKGIDIWGEDGYGPDIYFCLCRQCGVISCCNRCT